MKRISLTTIRELTNPFLSAGSGMAWYGGEMFIVADDQLELFSYPIKLDSPGLTWPLFEGKLPSDHRERKRLKPDLESLLVHEENLYCFPSGSTSHRMQGIKFNLNSRTSEIFDCRSLYETISETFSEINIEGSLVRNGELILFQRGNGLKNENGLIYVDFKTLTLKSIKILNLGKLGKVPLSFTDAALKQNKIYFVAVAENTQSTYEDGSIQGSVLGHLDENDDVAEMFQLATKSKPEGLWIEGEEFYIVTDDDNPERPSVLLKGPIPQD